jgi:hypothetical protein
LFTGHRFFSHDLDYHFCLLLLKQGEYVLMSVELMAFYGLCRGLSVGPECDRVRPQSGRSASVSGAATLVIRLALAISQARALSRPPAPEDGRAPPAVLTITRSLGMRLTFCQRAFKRDGPGIPLELIPALIGSGTESFPNGSGSGHAVATAKPHGTEPQFRILRPGPSMPAENSIARGTGSLDQSP